MLPVLIWLFRIDSQLLYAAAAPVANSNKNQTIVGWVPDPDGRGTFSLILSCVITLSLCVWSAIHLNIPQPNETIPQGYLNTSKWVLLGIVAPELVVFVAWRQFLSAKTLRDKVQELQKDDSYQAINPEKKAKVKTG